MVLRRSVWSQLFIFLPTVAVWVATAFVVQYAFFTYRYWQVGYLLVAVTLALVGVVLTYYGLELGRVEIRNKRLLAFTPLRKKWLDVELSDLNGFATAESDGEGVTVYNLVLDTPEGIRQLSLFGLAAQRYTLENQLPRGRFREELVKESARRDFAFVGYMFLLLGAGGLIWAGLNDALAQEDAGTVARFDVTVGDYTVGHSDGDWTETTLNIAGNEAFDFVIDELYFTEQEMEDCLAKIDKGYSVVSVWTYDKLFRAKIYDESGGLSWLQKHYGYGEIPVLQVAVGDGEYGDRTRGGDALAQRRRSNTEVTSYIAAGFLLLGGGILFFSKRRSRKRRFTEP